VGWIFRKKCPHAGLATGSLGKVGCSREVAIRSLRSDGNGNAALGNRRAAAALSPAWSPGQPSRPSKRIAAKMVDGMSGGHGLLRLGRSTKPMPSFPRIRALRRQTSHSGNVTVLGCSPQEHEPCRRLVSVGYLNVTLVAGRLKGIHGPNPGRGSPRWDLGILALATPHPRRHFRKWSQITSRTPMYPAHSVCRLQTAHGVCRIHLFRTNILSF
jgi:hypothetical protein